MKFLILTCVFFISACDFVSAKNSVFSEPNHFFDASDLDRPKRDIKSPYCPDGSNFIALDKNLIEEEFEYIATCYYENSSITIEHIWYGDEKLREFSALNGTKVGLEKFRLSSKLQGVAEYCDGKVTRIELYDVALNLQAIFLNVTPKHTNITTAIENADIHINLVDDSLSFGADIINKFDYCHHSFNDEKGEKVSKWLNWSWKYDLEKK